MFVNIEVRGPVLTLVDIHIQVVYIFNDTNISKKKQWMKYYIALYVVYWAIYCVSVEIRNYIFHSVLSYKLKTPFFM